MIGRLEMIEVTLRQRGGFRRVDLRVEEKGRELSHCQLFLMQLLNPEPGAFVVSLQNQGKGLKTKVGGVKPIVTGKPLD